MLVSLKKNLVIWWDALVALPSCLCRLLEPLRISFPHKYSDGMGGFLSVGNADRNGHIELNALCGDDVKVSQAAIVMPISVSSQRNAAWRIF